MRLIPIVERLRLACPVLARVDVGGLDPEPIADLAALPAAYLHPLEAIGADERPNRLAAGQVLRERIGVLIVAEVVAGATEPLQDARDQVLAALVHWRPAGSAHPLGHLKGEAIGASGRIVYWREVFEAHRLLAAAD